MANQNKIRSNGYESNVVTLEKAIQEAAEVYRKTLWNNDIQNQVSDARLPLPSKVIIDDEHGREVEMDFSAWAEDWMAKCRGRAVLIDVGVLGGWLLMQRKGDLGWHPFWHPFNPDSAPHLCIDPNRRNNFFLIGGNFEWTDLGVEDR